MARDFFKRQRADRPANGRKRFRPQLEALEDRCVLNHGGVHQWVGPDDGKWSDAVNWNPAALPGGNDTVQFQVSNTSNMDLGGVGTYNIGKIYIGFGQTPTIKLKGNLRVNVLWMYGGTIQSTEDPSKTLKLSQQGPAISETSYWTNGKIQVPFSMEGETAHRTTLVIGNLQGNAPEIDADLTITDEWSTLEWTQGDVKVNPGKTFTNKGTFKADSTPGARIFGNAAGMGQEWNFKNLNAVDQVPAGIFIMGKGDLKNVKDTNTGRRAKVASATPGNPDVFVVEGTSTQDGGGTTEVVYGTLSIIGTYTQLSGSTIVDAGQALSVSDAFTQSGGSVLVDGSGVAGSGGVFTVSGATTLSGGSLTAQLAGTFTAYSSFTQTGGSISVQGSGSLLSVTGAFQQSGGTITLGGTGGRLSAYGSLVVSGSAVLTLQNGLLDATSGVTIQSGATLNGYGGTITGDVTNAGMLNLSGGVYTLTITGNYTQTGTLKMALASSSAYSRLGVSGLATLGGTLDVDLLGWFMPSPGAAFALLTYGSRSGTFGTLDLPPLGFGHWDPRYDNPAGTFTLAVTY